MSNRGEGRVAISRQPGSMRVEIRPLVRGPRTAFALSAAAATVLGAALFGGARLADAWESGLRSGSFGDLPLPILALLTASVGLSTPFALLGLAALSFSEEELVVDSEALTIRTTAFERTRVTRIPLDEIECWRETWWPLRPWWTWTVRRLAAARRGGGLASMAAMAGPREKRRIAIALAKATGRPLRDPLGRLVEAVEEGIGPAGPMP